MAAAKKSSSSNSRDLRLARWIALILLAVFVIAWLIQRRSSSRGDDDSIQAPGESQAGETLEQLLAPSSGLDSSAPTRQAMANNWTKLTGCTLVEERYNDGDNVVVRHLGEDGKITSEKSIIVENRSPKVKSDKSGDQCGLGARKEWKAKRLAGERERGGLRWDRVPGEARTTRFTAAGSGMTGSSTSDLRAIPTRATRRRRRFGNCTSLDRRSNNALAFRAHPPGGPPSTQSV